MRAAFSMRWLMWLGVCSYSVYLWNYPFFRLMEMGKWPFGGVAAVACSMAVAVASFYWFEQPMRGWLRRERTEKIKQLQRATVESP
jgi:peptidoglycan/LPS O-acetylase OafA/YrhL